MTINVFDQFDGVPAKKTGNPFDQFDNAPSTQRPVPGPTPPAPAAPAASPGIMGVVAGMAQRFMQGAPTAPTLAGAQPQTFLDNVVALPQNAYRTVGGAVADAADSAADAVNSFPNALLALTGQSARIPQSHVGGLIPQPTGGPNQLGRGLLPYVFGEKGVVEGAKAVDAAAVAAKPILSHMIAGGGVNAVLAKPGPEGGNLSNIVADATGGQVQLPTAHKPTDDKLIASSKDVVEGAVLGTVVERLGRFFTRGSHIKPGTPAAAHEEDAVEQAMADPRVVEQLRAGGIDESNPKFAEFQARAQARQAAQDARQNGPSIVAQAARDLSPPPVPPEIRAKIDAGELPEPPPGAIQPETASQLEALQAAPNQGPAFADQIAAVLSGDVHPAAVATPTPPQVPPVIAVDAAGRADAGDLGARTGANLRTPSNLPVPTEAPTPRMSDAQIAQAQADGRPNPIPPRDRMAAPEGRAPQTAADQETQRESQQAFDLAQRQRERVGPGVRDTQTGGLPRGPEPTSVLLDEGFPVRVVDMTPDGRVTVERYDPRTGHAEADAVPYTVPASKLSRASYTPEPRRAQDFGARDNPARTSPELPGGGREPTQTYRATSPDPNTDFPGPVGPDGPEPVGRSPFPEQPAGPHPGRSQPFGERAQRAANEEELRRRYEERQRQHADDAFEQAARSQYRGKAQDSTNTEGARDAEGRYPVDENGFVRSDKGGPIVFADQKQAAKWVVKVGHAQSPDQIFEIANHPTKKGRFTVVERGRSEPKAAPEAEAPPERPTAAPESETVAPAPAKALPGPEEKPPGAKAEAKAKFDALVAETRARSARAADLAAADKPVRFEHTDGRRSLVSKDPANGKWRVTRFDKDGEPWGHEEFANGQEAFMDPLSSGAEPVARDAPEPAAPRTPQITSKQVEMSLGRGKTGKYWVAVVDGRERAEFGHWRDAATAERKAAEELRPKPAPEAKAAPEAAPEAAPKPAPEPGGIANPTHQRMAEKARYEKRLAAHEEAVAKAKAQAEKLEKSEPLSKQTTKAREALQRAERARDEFAEAHGPDAEPVAGAPRAEGEAPKDAKSRTENDLNAVILRAQQLKAEGKDGVRLRYTMETASGRQTTFTMPADPEKWEGLKSRLVDGKRPMAAGHSKGAPEPVRSGKDRVQFQEIGPDGKVTNHDYEAQFTKGDRGGAYNKPFTPDRFYSNPLDPEAIHGLLLKPAGEAIKAAASAAGKAVRDLREELRSSSAIGQTFGSMTRLWNVFTAENGRAMRMLARRYEGPAGDRINWLADQVASAPGEGRTVAQTFERAFQARANAMATRLANILGHTVDEAFDTKVADVLSGRARAAAGSRVAEVAARVRRLLDDQHAYIKAAGVDVGYVRGSYFPRMVDPESVSKDVKGFLDSAGKLYRRMGLSVSDAEQAAQDWLNRLSGVTNSAHASGLPSSRFTKGRTLPPEADRILAPYLVRDPRSALAAYFRQTSRSAEATRRFGVAGEKIDDMFTELTRHGVALPDQQVLRDHFNSATGHMYAGARAPGGIAKIGSWMQTIGVLKLLPRAVLSSMTEALGVGVRAHDVTAGLGAFVDAFRELTSLRNKDGWREAAEHIGVVGDAMNDLMLASRYGDGMTKAQARLMSGFFRINGLHAITEAQRVTAARAGGQFVKSLLDDVGRATSRKASALRLLNELGIEAKDVPALRTWLGGDTKPALGDLGSGKAHVAKWEGAIQRFVDESIQNPSAADKPMLANHPVGRLAYGITGFMFSFTKNVLARTVRETREGFFGHGYTLDDRMRLLAPAMALGLLSASQVGLSEMRDRLLNPQGFAERSASDQAIVDASRASLTGTADPFVNLLLSAKYERDASSLITGPYLGDYSTNLFAIMKGALPNGTPGNSANTNNTEWNASRALEAAIIAPAVTAGLSLATGAAPAPLKVAAFAGAQAISAPGTARAFADATVGERTVKPRPLRAGNVGNTDFSLGRDQQSLSLPGESAFNLGK